jgi:phosphatidylserine/phosphatidylglycerophosphate/cardiolipin synthase-like enzyme
MENCYLETVLDPINRPTLLNQDNTQADELIAGGIPVRFNSVGRGILHDKFAVIDAAIVITGSYNWTTAAETLNAENLLIIRGGDIASRYETEFLRLWNGGKP